MRPKTITLSLETPTLDNICEDQTTGGAADLVIDGTLAVNGVITLDTAHRIDFESAGDIQAVVFTITGTDNQGQPLTDTVTGVNISTVTSSEYFKTITQIAASAAVGTNVSVGTTDEAISQIVPLDFQSTDFQVGLFATITGTINYTVQHTGNNVLEGDTPVWFNHVSLVSQVVNGDGNYIVPVAATQLVVNSFTDGATINLDILQSS